MPERIPELAELQCSARESLLLPQVLVPAIAARAAVVSQTIPGFLAGML